MRLTHEIHFVIALLAVLSACSSTDEPKRALGTSGSSGVGGDAEAVAEAAGSTELGRGDARGSTTTGGGTDSDGSAGANIGDAPSGPAPDGQGPARVDDLDVGDPGLDQTAQVTVPSPGGPVPFFLWIPGGVKVIRGIALNVKPDIHYAEFARLTNFALMTLDDTFANFGGAAEPLLQAAKLFGDQLGHPELANVCFVATGHSRYSGGGFNLDNERPDRLIVGATGGLEFLPKGEGQKAPYLVWYGGVDNTQPRVLNEDLDTARGAHALFGIAPQWGEGHAFGVAANLIQPTWFQAVARRIAKDKSPLDGPAPLKPIPEESGWLGSRTGWTVNPQNGKGSIAPLSFAEIQPFDKYTGDKTKAVWLLDSYVAHTWRAFVTPDDSVKITSPAYIDNDSHSAVTLIEPGAKLPVKITVRDLGTPIVKVDVYDGDLPLGSSSSAPYEIPGVALAPGIHAIIAIATTQDGAQLSSRPSTVFAIRHTCPVNPGGGFPASCVKQ